MGPLTLQLCLNWYAILNLRVIFSERAYHHNFFQVISGVCLIYAFWPSDTARSVVGWLLFTVNYFIPIFILVYGSGRIVWMLTRRIGSNLSKNGNQSNLFHVARKNTIQTFLLISLCFAICWSCLQVNFLLYNLGFPPIWNTAFYKVATLMAFCNCMINPFVYLMKYKDFQDGLKYLCTHGVKIEDDLLKMFHSSETDILTISEQKSSNYWFIQALRVPKIYQPLCSQPCSQINISWDNIPLSRWRPSHPKRILYSAIRKIVTRVK